MKIIYLVLPIAIMLALIIAGPVSAYSISVSDMKGGDDISPVFHSYPNRIQATRFVPSNSMDIAAATNSNGSRGSVSAFSKGAYQDQTTVVEFRNSVSVDGIIEGFSYSARYDSGIFR